MQAVGVQLGGPHTPAVTAQPSWPKNVANTIAKKIQEQLLEGMTWPGMSHLTSSPFRW